MSVHPLDECIIDLLSAQRGIEDAGFGFPGFLRDKLDSAFDRLYAYRRDLNYKQRLSTCEALNLMLEASLMLSEGSDPDKCGRKFLDAALSLYPVADWPTNVCGKTWEPVPPDSEWEGDELSREER